MRGLRYQLKNMRRDKMCIMTFLLPVIAGLAIQLLSGVSFASISENSFGALENGLSAGTVQWLRNYGNMSTYESMDSLETAVNDPATQMIGVLQSGEGIRTILSGDELRINTVIANTLPRLYEQRENTFSFNVKTVPGKSDNDGMQSLLIVITMVTAMFMGCTFNAMNIIGEKEDGIALINEILPMTTAQYMGQKMTLGFLGGVISTVMTALICVRIKVAQIIPLFLLIVLSALIAALVGMFIGRLSGGLMTGIIYIKVIMILFIAPPILFYLVLPTDGIGHILSLLLPSSPSFYGLMGMLNGQTQYLWIYILALAGHSIVWGGLMIAVRKNVKKYF